jgi:dephospho-CoA kinase
VPYIVYEAALLVEGGLHRAMSALVVVTSDASLQQSRIRSRDGLDSEQSLARIAAQLPTADKVAVADYVIENDGSLAQLQARTRDLHLQLVKRFAHTP